MATELMAFDGAFLDDVAVSSPHHDPEVIARCQWSGGMAIIPLILLLLSVCVVNSEGKVTLVGEGTAGGFTKCEEEISWLITDTLITASWRFS